MMVGFDLETTGPDPFSDVPVSFAVVLHGSDLPERTESRLVNPGRPIPAEATAVHKITDDHVRSAMDLDEAIERIALVIESAGERGEPVVGMNISFDLTIVSRIRCAMGGPELRVGPVVDVLVLDRGLDKWRKGKRNLSALCAHYGVNAGSAHDALADARASMEVFAKISERFPQILEKSPGELTEVQAEWNRQWADDFDRYLRSNGREPLHPRQWGWPLLA
jgi:DNA polymerase-3 subunit epsilon